LYDPEQFGILELILRTSSFFAVLATFRLDLAIPLPKDELKAKYLLILSVAASFLVSTISLLIFILVREELVGFVKHDEFSFWLNFLPILILLSALTQCWNSLLLRLGKFSMISISKIADSFVNTGGKIFGGYFISASTSALVLPTFIGLGVACILPIFYLANYLRSAFNMFDFQKLKNTFSDYSEFPRINLPHALLDTVQIGLTVFLISHFFNATSLGLYALNLRILKTPTIIIGTTAGQIFFRTAASMYSKGENISKLFIKYLVFFAGLGIFIFVPLAIFGPELFAFVFGPSWYISGVLAQYTSAWMFMNFIASALSYLPLVVKQQKNALSLNVINFALVMISILTGYYIFDSFISCIILLSAVESVYFLALIFWYYKISIRH
jgi:O-antigen/teichoic acid export membrane protein